MLLNILALATTGLLILSNWLIRKSKHEKLIIKILLGILFTYKVVIYVIENIKGNVSIPVEISSISYFLVPLIFFFNIKSLYGVAAFLSLTAGVGFFGFYSVVGFVAAKNFTIFKFIVALFGHGSMLLCGLYLFSKYDLKKFSKNTIQGVWISMLSIIAWASLFAEVKMKGYPFIYYLIRPKYLYNVFASPVLNALLICVFAAAVVVLFKLYVDLFFKLNSKFHNRKEIKNNIDK